jgi:hypothetical protein
MPYFNLKYGLRAQLNRDRLSNPHSQNTLYYMNDNIQDDVQHDLNLETGRLTWPEIQRHFALGLVLNVSKSLDLIEVARKFIADDKTTIEQWLDNGQIAKASDDDARLWHDTKMELWAVVTAPWVLVQEITS